MNVFFGELAQLGIDQKLAKNSLLKNLFSPNIHSQFQ